MKMMRSHVPELSLCGLIKEVPCPTIAFESSLNHLCTIYLIYLLLLLKITVVVPEDIPNGWEFRVIVFYPYRVGDL